MSQEQKLTGIPEIDTYFDTEQSIINLSARLVDAGADPEKVGQYIVLAQADPKRALVLLERTWPRLLGIKRQTTP